MYAATVTGAPVENACRLIADYEPEGRGYYGAALALFGRASDGTPASLIARSSASRICEMFRTRMMKPGSAYSRSSQSAEHNHG